MPPLDRPALVARLDAELARTQRLGGFLSVILFGDGLDLRQAAGPGAPLGSRAALLAGRIRGYDFAGACDSLGIAVVMPGSTSSQALAAGRRLLSALTADPAFGSTVRAGIASTYGEIEGGAEALLEAAYEAQKRSLPGSVVLSETQRGRPRILVIDDDTVFARSLCDAIEGDDWQADPCSDVADARQRLLESIYHGLFVDIIIPGAGGVDLLRESLGRFPHRPAILMSGYDTNHESILDALALGPIMFVRKPIAPRDLEASLRMFRVLLPGVPGR